jgi:protein involved in polysaccharide export with SLBB domain
VLRLNHGKYTREMLNPVDARGMLHVGAGNDVAVVGLSLHDAEQRVRQLVNRRDRFAQVDLNFSDRPTQRISVLGALTRPGYLELTKGMRVTDLVAAAGGLVGVTDTEGTRVSPIANLADAALVRDGKALPIDVDAALRGAPKHNVYIHPGDQLYVPFATDQLVSVFGQVLIPGVFVHRKGMRLTEALSAAGGIAIGGDKSDIRVVRGPVEAPTAYQASLRAIVEEKSHDVALAAGDVVFVADDPIEDVGEVFDIVTPLMAIAVSVITVAALFIYPPVRP